ncbi:DUF1622 domain-containing protein [Desulfonatronum parangueonense]
MTEFFKMVVLLFETLAVGVLIGGFFYFGFRMIIQWLRPVKHSSAYSEFRKGFGRTLLLALDLLVAADLVLTMVIEQSLKSLGLLMGLVIVRTFLHVIIEMELTGHWPWQHGVPAAEKPDVSH